ncbi:MAG: hypothetical protein QW576_03295 [Candidatus Korarchaeum sp.]
MDELSSEDTLVRIRRVYEEVLDRKERTDEELRTLAYLIGKLNGLVNSLKLIDRIREQVEDELTKKAMQSLEAKRAFLDGLPERRPEDYERFSMEVERVNDILKAQREAMRKVIEVFSSKVNAEAAKVEREIEERRRSRKDNT